MMVFMTDRRVQTVHSRCGRIRMLLFCAALFFVLMAGRASAESKRPYFISADLSSTEDGIPTDAVSLFKKKDGYYIFFPAAWDCNNLIVRCRKKTDTLFIGGIAYHDGDRVSLPPGTSTVMSVDDHRWNVVNVLQSSVVPSIFLTTDDPDTKIFNSEFTDKTVKEPGVCKIVNADGTVEYDGELSYVRIRGNSTRNVSKKPLQIKLDKKRPLFGMSTNKTWILLANYADKSLIRTTIAMDLARYAGVYSFVPATQPVDLFVNHQYYGSFLLTEKCEIDNHRLDITDLEQMNDDLNPGEYPAFGPDKYSKGAKKGVQLEKIPKDITGGYLILAAYWMYYEQDPSGFVTERGQSFLIDSPKRASEAQVDYIEARFRQIEDALFTDGTDENGTPWTEWLDETTFVHRYLQAEVTGDNDGNNPYFYKDTDTIDPKIYCGPVWDQDNIWGVNKAHADPDRFYIQNEQLSYAWFPAAMKLPDFAAKVRQTYREVYLPALEILLGLRKDPSGVLRSLDEYAAEVAGTAALDNVRWRIASHRNQVFNMTGDTPEENIAFLRDYITRRMNFLNSEWLVEK